MDELKKNLQQGTYLIPSDLHVSFECLDFLNCCLRYDPLKRKDFGFLDSHPFLTQASEVNFQDLSTNLNSNNALFRTGSVFDYSHGIQMNTKESYVFKEIYQNFFVKKSDRKLENAIQNRYRSKMQSISEVESQHSSEKKRP